VTVLIRSPIDDLHAWAVRWAIQTKGVKCDFWDTSMFPAQSQLSSRISNNKDQNSNAFSKNFADVAFSTYNTIWNRRGSNFAHLKGLSEGDKRYAQNESRYYLASLHVLLSSSIIWVNDPIGQIVANQKLYQLQVAQKSGLLIPETIASNDPTKVRSFAEEFGPEIVFKPFEIGMWRNAEEGNYHISYATKISLRELEDDASIQASPGIYQQAIQKKYDIRVLVAGASYVAVKINSDGAKEHGIDWRAAKNAVMERCTISDPVFCKIRTLMETLGIVTGAVDLVVNTEGQTYFIEVNESGQFLFMEEACTAAPVLDLMSSFLIKPSKEFIWSDAYEEGTKSVSLKNFYESGAFDDFVLATKGIAPSNTRPML
jgi:glutathione synthase/RimK-type ligase-like ATP-grasp enzyme